MRKTDGAAKLMVFAVLLLASVITVAEWQVASGNEHRPDRAVNAPHASSTLPALLLQYEPILYLHPLESFLPMDVDSFVDSCSLWKNNVGQPDEEIIAEGNVLLDGLNQDETHFLKFVQQSPLPTFAEQVGSDQPTPVASLSSIMRFLTAQALAEYRGIEGESLTYYARQTEDAGYIVLQYWFFYAYNSLGAYPNLVGLGNVHEGDWEMISIFLNPGAPAPEYVAYSAHHDSGSDVTMRWDDIPKVQGHPVVYVALGSHANYFSAGRTPIDLPIPLESQDVTSARGLHVGPGQDTEWEQRVLLDETSLPVWARDYAGNWGIDVALDDGPVLLNALSGPHGPVFQGDRWDHPVSWDPPPVLPSPPLLVANRRSIQLSQNYPNPCNPETWLPYELAEAADVSLSIFDVAGHLVRHLSLGHRPAGRYQSRSAAAYWDGRDETGQIASSGVYVVRLQAGEESAVRRIVLRK